MAVLPGNMMIPEEREIDILLREVDGDIMIPLIVIPGNVKGMGRNRNEW